MYVCNVDIYSCLIQTSLEDVMSSLKVNELDDRDVYIQRERDDHSDNLNMFRIEDMRAREHVPAPPLFFLFDIYIPKDID
jgi:hypothetical protein